MEDTDSRIIVCVHGVIDCIRMDDGRVTFAVCWECARAIDAAHGGHVESLRPVRPEHVDIPPEAKKAISAIPGFTGFFKLQDGPTWIPLLDDSQTDAVN